MLTKFLPENISTFIGYTYMAKKFAVPFLVGYVMQKYGVLQGVLLLAFL